MVGSAGTSIIDHHRFYPLEPRPSIIRGVKEGEWKEEGRRGKQKRNAKEGRGEGRINVRITETQRMTEGRNVNGDEEEQSERT